MQPTSKRARALIDPADGSNTYVFNCFFLKESWHHIEEKAAGFVNKCVLVHLLNVANDMQTLFFN